MSSSKQVYLHLANIYLQYANKSCRCSGLCGVVTDVWTKVWLFGGWLMDWLEA